MATVAIDTSHLLESRMFSQVLNLYVANTVAQFLTSTLSLLTTDRLCDFCVALQRRPSAASFFCQSSRGDTWDASFIQRKGSLVAELCEQLYNQEPVISLDSIQSGPAFPVAEAYRCEIAQTLQSNQVVLVFLAELGAPGSLQFSLHRCVDSETFAGKDLHQIEILRRYIENAWSLLNQRLASRALLDGISVALRNYHRGTLMLDSRFRVIWHNRAGRECLQCWRNLGRSPLKPSRSLGPLPGDIISVCEEVRGQWFKCPSKSDLRKSHVVRHAVDPRLLATVKLYGVNLSGLASPNFMVQFENPVQTTRSGGKRFVDSLTSGEREVAGLVQTGMSNQEIADQLGKTVVAIKFHLHRIFKKAEVKNRARLMIRLTEARA